MNSAMKIVSRGLYRNLSAVPRRIPCAPAYEAAVNHRRCSLSIPPTPPHFTSASNEISETLKRHGVTNEKIIQKVVCMPVLSSGNPEAWNKLMTTLVNLGFKPSSIVHMTLEYPKLLKFSPERLQKSWQGWFECFQQHEIVRELIVTHPMLFSLGKGDIHSRFDLLRAIIGSAKFVAVLLKNCPQIMFQNLAELTAVADYISTKMVVRNTADYYKSVALGCSLDEIKTRHVFLERCGKYKTPNLKQSDKIPTSNPSLSQIYDTSEEEFSTKIVGVTLEEFVVFRSMFEKEMKDKADDSDANSDSDDSEDEK